MQNNIIEIDMINAYIHVCEDIRDQVGGARQVILKKLISNIKAVRLLLIQDMFNEAKIILRSMQESIVLFCYLSEFPDKEQDYILNCELMGLKTHFIFLKNIKEEIDRGNQANLDWEKAVKDHETKFTQLTKTNKDFILKKLSITDYKIDDESFNAIDKFYKNATRIKKPFFMNLENMYKQLNPLFEEGIELREMIFSDYNMNSLITHGHWHSWLDKTQIENEFRLRNQISSVINIPILYAKNKGIKVDDDKLNKLEFLISNITT